MNTRENGPPRVCLGLIGAGRWGRNYIRTITGMEGVQLTRLATGNPENRNLVDSACRISSDWREVTEASDLDGVIIATPPDVHAEMTHASIAAGLPVLVEKPLTLDCAEADSLLKAARAKNALVVVDHTLLYSSGFRELSRRARELGAMRRIISEAGNWGPFRNSVSVLWDWGAHDVAMSIALAGAAPSAIEATLSESQTTEGGIGESFSLRLCFPAGFTADIEISNLRRDKQRRFAACFNSLALVYDDVGDKKLAIHDIDGSGGICPAPREAIAIDTTPPLTRVIEEFVVAVTEGANDTGSLELATKVVDALAQCETFLQLPTASS